MLVSLFICFYYEISQHLCPWSARDTLDSRLFWTGPMSTSVKWELRECSRGQPGVPSVKLHWINTHFSPTQQQECLFLRSDYTHSPAPCTCMPTVRAIDTSCTVNPFGEILALYCVHRQHLSASRLSALLTSTHLVCEGCSFKCAALPSLHPLRRQQTSANWKHFSKFISVGTNLYWVFLEITNKETLCISSVVCCDLFSIPAFSWNETSLSIVHC